MPPVSRDEVAVKSEFRGNSSVPVMHEESQTRVGELSEGEDDELAAGTETSRKPMKPWQVVGLSGPVGDLPGRAGN